MSSVLGLLEENVKLNLSSSSMPVRVKALHWGEDVSEFSPPFDVILAADVVYQCMNVDSLVKALCDLSGPNTLILIAYESHEDVTPALFQEQVEKKFLIHEVPKQEMDPVYNKSSIRLIRLTKLG